MKKIAVLQVEFDTDIMISEEDLKDLNIVSILTKECFESMEYKVKE